MVSLNARVKNATPTVYNGIKFRSRFEADAAKILEQNNIAFEYESFNIILQDKFRYNDKVIRPITYTPDFILTDYNLMLEIKGFKTDSYTIKSKLLKHWLVFDNQKNYKFAEVFNKTQLLKLINELKK